MRSPVWNGVAAIASDDFRSISRQSSASPLATLVLTSTLYVRFERRKRPVLPVNSIAEVYTTFNFQLIVHNNVGIVKVAMVDPHPKLGPLVALDNDRLE